MTYQEAYSILGINSQASMEEIKSAYKKQAKKYHPDIYQGDKKFAEEKMRKINEAYTLISTPQSHNFDYGTKFYDEAYEFQRMRHEYMRDDQAQKEFEEHMKKVQEELEKMQKEMEERNKKMKKMFRPILILLFIILEIYIIQLFSIAIKSLIHCFNEAIWFSFGYWILLGIIALAGIILAPIGFIWLMRKAKIFKK